jgi:membrane protein required for colicin V production
VLLVFFVLGLFKGIVWQVSRVVILMAAYAASASLGPAFADVLLGWTHTGPAPPTQEQHQTAFYIACVLLFLGVLVALSLLALLLQKLVKKAGLGFYDRLFGGVVGVGSGAIVVLFLLTVVYMFFPDSAVAEAASRSQSLRLSRQAVDMLGNVVPDELRTVLPQPSAPAAPATTDQAEPGTAGK